MYRSREEYSRGDVYIYTHTYIHIYITCDTVISANSYDFSALSRCKNVYQHLWLGM